VDWGDIGSGKPAASGGANAISEAAVDNAVAEPVPPPPPVPAAPAVPAEPIAPPEAATQAAVETPAPPPSAPPSSEATFVDSRDNKTYKKVTIGAQTWMAQNLDYAGFPYADVPRDLYTWPTAMKACPAGWHLPSGPEWAALIEYAGGASEAGKKLKSKTGWPDNGSGTDDYGFSAVPGTFAYEGGATDDGEGTEDGAVLWWSATESDAKNAWYLTVSGGKNTVNRDKMAKGFFFSVRCVQD